jgi:hypothetical protein
LTKDEPSKVLGDAGARKTDAPLDAILKGEPMTTRNTSNGNTNEPVADRWTRDSLTLRRMTRTNIWTLSAAAVVIAVALTLWAVS